MALVIAALAAEGPALLGSARAEVAGPLSEAVGYDSAKCSPQSSGQRRHCVYRLVRWATAIVLLAASGARADDVPGIGNWEHYHYSLDETPIDVLFIHDSREGEFPVLTIPRRYVYFANGAPPSTDGPLPDSIETNDLGIAFTHPNGAAWSAAVRDYASEHAISADAAAKMLRSSQILLKISPSSNPDMARAFREATIRNGTFVAALYPDIPEYRDSETQSSFLGGQKDKFIRASCYNPLNPVYFCKYIFLVINNLFVQASFLDFRLHGGPEYANQRLRFAREVVCRFMVDC